MDCSAASRCALSLERNAALYSFSPPSTVSRPQRQQVLPLRHREAGSAAPYVAQLSMWTAVEQHNVLTLRAEPSAMKIVNTARNERDAFAIEPAILGARVARMHDLSGRGNDVYSLAPERRPLFVPDCLGPGIGALEFGNSILQTAPFEQPLKQPVTLIVVAKCRGDTTICDSLSPSSARFELCHGYPPASATGNPQICISAHGSGRSAPNQLLRGNTRSENTWHVYTAVYDGPRSALYVDGVMEASGKSVGNGMLDGLRIGCDHTSTFFLKGSIAELRMYDLHLADAPREQLEAALALRYGLTPHNASTPAAASPSPAVMATANSTGDVRRPKPRKRKSNPLRNPLRTLIPGASGRWAGGRVAALSA